MKIIEFAVKITEIEAGKTQVSIAQVLEILKIINAQLFGIPYFLIKIKKKKS